MNKKKYVYGLRDGDICTQSVRASYYGTMVVSPEDSENASYTFRGYQVLWNKDGKPYIEGTWDDMIAMCGKVAIAKRLLDEDVIEGAQMGEVNEDN